MAPTLWQRMRAAVQHGMLVKCVGTQVLGLGSTRREHTGRTTLKCR